MAIPDSAVSALSTGDNVNNFYPQLYAQATKAMGKKNFDQLTTYQIILAQRQNECSLTSLPQNSSRDGSTQTDLTFGREPERCPILREIITDAAVLNCGHAVSRAALAIWPPEKYGCSECNQKLVDCSETQQLCNAVKRIAINEAGRRAVIDNESDDDEKSPIEDDENKEIDEAIQIEGELDEVQVNHPIVAGEVEPGLNEGEGGVELGNNLAMRVQQLEQQVQNQFEALDFANERIVIHRDAIAFHGDRIECFKKVHNTLAMVDVLQFAFACSLRGLLSSYIPANSSFIGDAFIIWSVARLFLAVKYKLFDRDPPQ